MQCTHLISNLHCVNVILQVRDKFGARVIFPQKSTDDDAEVITIIGRKEKAEAARDHLRKLIKDLVSIHHQLFTTSLLVKHQSLGYDVKMHHH